MYKCKCFKCKTPSMMSSLSASVVLSSAKTKSSALQMTIVNMVIVVNKLSSYNFPPTQTTCLCLCSKGRYNCNYKIYAILPPLAWRNWQFLCLYLQIQSTYPVSSFSSFCCSFKAMKPARDSTLSFSFANSLRVFVMRN